MVTVMMPRKENIIEVKSELFSDRIVKMFQYLSCHRHENVLSKQILRSGTSIGANVVESFNAQSDADFISHVGDYFDMPVLIDYYTYYPNPSTGKLEKWSDIYGYDKIVLKAIKPFIH